MHQGSREYSISKGCLELLSGRTFSRGVVVQTSEVLGLGLRGTVRLTVLRFTYSQASPKADQDSMNPYQLPLLPPPNTVFSPDRPTELLPTVYHRLVDTLGPLLGSLRCSTSP